MSANRNGGHPDPTGPEPPEDGPKAAHDGAGNGKDGRNLRDALTEDGGDSAAPPEAPPLPGDRQLSLGGLGRRGQPIEAQVSMMSAGVRASGVFEPDKERLLAVSVLPREYRQRPIREGGETKRWKYVQQVRPTEVRTITDARHLIVAEMREAFEDAPRILEALDALHQAFEEADERELAAA